MYKRMKLVLWIGIISMVVGITLAILGFTPKSVPALVTAIGAGWIGAAMASKLNKGMRDEMVVRVEHASAYYTLNATFCLIFVLNGLRMFANWTLKVGDVLFTLMMFMSVSYLLLKYVLLRRGNAE